MSKYNKHLAKFYGISEEDMAHANAKPKRRVTIDVHRQVYIQAKKVFFEHRLNISDVVTALFHLAAEENKLTLKLLSIMRDLKVSGDLRKIKQSERFKHLYGEHGEFLYQELERLQNETFGKLNEESMYNQVPEPEEEKPNEDEVLLSKNQIMDKIKAARKGK